MNEKVTDSISVLVDGELDGRSQAQALDGALRRDELRRRWSRYHLVRDALRHGVQPRLADELVARVRGALDEEPAHAASVRPMSRTWRRLPVAPVAGLALAASVAAIAIVGVRSLGPEAAQQAPSAPPADVVAQPMLPPLGGSAAGGGLAQRAADRVGAEQRPRAVALGTLQWDAQPEVEARLNGYLVSHSEYLGNGMRGMLPYARIVGYDTSDRR